MCVEQRHLYDFVGNKKATGCFLLYESSPDCRGRRAINDGQIGQRAAAVASDNIYIYINTRQGTIDHCYTNA